MTNTKSLVYVGIDPGYRRCGIGVVSHHDGTILEFMYLEAWTPNELYNELDYLNQKYKIMCIGIEHVHTMKNQGISSSGKFMKATGIIIGTVNAMRITYCEITPQKWKTLNPIFKSVKGETRTKKKARVLTYIEKYYPNCGLLEFKARKDAKIDIADAICIAIYMYENSL
jgi:Holliday junction resolvasome RuvABC endonuclease subunit